MTQAPQVETMTVDHVIVRTVALIGATFVSAMVTWSMVFNGLENNDSGAVGTAMAIGGVGFAVALVAIIISMFRPVTNPVLAFAYSIGQGLLLGGISAIAEARYPGIVINALVGTMLVFFGMLALYKTGAIRNSPMFTKVMVGAGFGIFGLLAVNALAGLVGINLGLFASDGQSPTWLQWGLAIGMTLWAAFSFVLDFDMIEWSVKSGAAKKYAWAGAFGLTAGLIFLYWNLLMLLRYFQE